MSDCDHRELPDNAGYWIMLFLEQPFKFTCACQVARFARILIYSMMFAE
jgi:hypothetical protein